MATSSDDEQPAADPLEPAVEKVADQIPREIKVYQLGVQRLYVRDWETVALYKRAGTTSDLEVMADHDGPVILDGKFRLIERGEYGFPKAHHPHGGRMGTLDEDDVDDPAVLLQEVKRRV